MSHHFFAIVSYVSLLAAVVGCGASNPPPNSSSTTNSLPSQNASAERHAETRGAAADRSRVESESARHLAASGKVFDIMMEEFDPNAFRKLVAVLLPNNSPKEQQTFLTQFVEIFHSPEFRKDYSEILMETFSAAECERLAELLADPVLRKYQHQKAEHMTRLMTLADKHFEKQFRAKGAIKGQNE